MHSTDDSQCGASTPSSKHVQQAAGHTPRSAGFLITLFGVVGCRRLGVHSGASARAGASSSRDAVQRAVQVRQLSLMRKTETADLTAQDSCSSEVPS